MHIEDLSDVVWAIWSDRNAVKFGGLGMAKFAVNYISKSGLILVTTG